MVWDRWGSETRMAAEPWPGRRTGSARRAVGDSKSLHMTASAVHMAANWVPLAGALALLCRRSVQRVVQGVAARRPAQRFAMDEGEG